MSALPSRLRPGTAKLDLCSGTTLFETITVIIISMNPTVARQVNGLRRVGVPKSLAELTGIEANQYVTISRSKSSRWTLLVRPAVGPDEEAHVRDPHRPRRVNAMLQVTLPLTLMAHIELEKHEWVFLSPDSRRRGLRVVPQAKVTLAEQDPSSSVRTWVPRRRAGAGDQDRGVPSQPSSARNTGDRA